MNSLASYRTFFFGIFLLTLCAPGTVQAQSEAESAENVLVFQHQESGKIEAFGAPRPFNYRMKSRWGIRHGYLEEIRDSSIVVSGVEVPLTDIAMMEPRNAQMERNGLTIMGATGFVFLSSSATAIIYDFSNRNNPRFDQVLPMTIFVIGYVFTAMTFPLGLIIYALGRSRFQLKKNQWDLRIERADAHEVVK